MTKEQSFNKWLKQTNAEHKIVDAHWPYNYNNNKGHLVTYKGVTQYLFFNDDGILLVQKRVDKE